MREGKGEGRERGRGGKGGGEYSDEHLSSNFPRLPPHNAGALVQDILKASSSCESAAGGHSPRLLTTMQPKTAIIARDWALSEIVFWPCMLGYCPKLAHEMRASRKYVDGLLSGDGDLGKAL